MLRIISEPVAATIAYGIKNNPQDERDIIVVDFGGGTLDICAVHLKKG